MNDRSITNPAYLGLTDQQLSEIDELCDRFDQELVNGNAPRLEDFLAEAPETARDGVLSELLAMELEYRFQQNEKPQADEYKHRFPEHHRIVEAVFAQEATTEFPGSEHTSDSDFAPPEVGNFQLIEELGRGGMGVVWLAEQTHPVKRRVALKLIKSDLTAKEVIARFDAEKQALAMMDHPNIARVLDAGTTVDGRPYFVMELVDGIPITEYCDEHKLSVDERLQLFVSVCRAVQHAHQKGIIHRDLKPSNVMVTVIDGQSVPKVIDFGLAKAVEQDLQLTDETMQTEFGKVVGTVQYMSPEQAELKGPDAEDIDTRTDIYSLGVMLYELLTGSTPVDKDTLGQKALLKVLQIIREEDPPRPSSRLSSSSHDVNAAVSDLRRLHPARLQQLLRGELDWVVMKALEKDRSRRYQTANDLGQDLSNYLTGAAVAARPPSTLYQLQKFANRNRGLVVAVCTIVLLLIGGITGTTFGLLRANQKTKLAEKKTEEAVEARSNAIEERAKAIKAKDLAIDATQQAEDAKAALTFQLAVARFDTHRAEESRNLLHQVPEKYRETFEWRYCQNRFQGSGMTCYGHVEQVFEVAFTPDGKQLVSAGESGIVRQWDSTSGRHLRQFKHHEGDVMGLAISPGGKLIASAGFDRVVRLCEQETGVIVRTLTGHQDRINCVAFSLDGKRLATASSDRTVRIWDTDSGSELVAITGHTSSVTGVAFSPDGELIASSSSDDRTVRIWNSRNGEQVRIVYQGDCIPRHVVFSPDGKRLATVDYGRYALWDVDTWNLVAIVNAHNHLVRCIRFSPDGSRFATGCDGGLVKLWDTETRNLVATFSGHTSSINGLGFSPDGRRLASAGEDQTIRLWDIRRDSNDLIFHGHSKHVHCVGFSPNGKQLASGSATILLRNALTGETRFKLKGHSADVADLAFNPDGSLLASAADDNTVRLWSTETGRELAVLEGHTHWVSGVAFSPDGTFVASSSRDGTIKFWNAQTFEETASLKGHRGVIYDLAISPDGKTIVSGGADQTVRLWDVKSQQEIRTLVGHTGLVRSVAFDPQGQRVVSSGYDPSVRVWDVDSGNQIVTGHVRSAAVFRVAFSNDGQRFIALGTDDFLQIFDSSTGKEVAVISPPTGGITAIDFSPDGSRLALGQGSGRVRICEAPNESETTFLGGHVGKVNRATFSEDGSRFYSESDSEKLVWDFATRSIIPTATWEPPTSSLRLSPDGRWLLTSELNNIVLVDLEYRNSPTEMERRVCKAKFEPGWHQEQAMSATQAKNWYAAAFHLAWLCRDEPRSPSCLADLQLALCNLLGHHNEDGRSRFSDVAGDSTGTFYSRNEKQLVTVVSSDVDRMLESKSPTSSAAVNRNKAIYFNGTNRANLQMPSFYSQSFTVEGWVKPDAGERFADGRNAFAVFTLSPNEKDTALSAEIDTVGRFRVIHRESPGGAGGTNLFSKSKLADAQWFHFAVVRGQDKRLRLFINGDLEATSDDFLEDFADQDFNIDLGRSVAKNPRYFKGLMDDVRFWDRGRFAEEIRETMGIKVNPDHDGLVAGFDFDQVQSEFKLSDVNKDYFFEAGIDQVLENLFPD